MSRINDLLEFYLTNSAVEWRSLDSIARRNKGFSVTAKLINEQKSNKEGILVFGAGNTKAYFNPKLVPENRTLKKECVIVKSRGYIDFEYCNIPCAHKSELWSYTCDSSLISTKFLYFFLKTLTESLQNQARATSVKIPQLSVGDTDSLMIPVPPLEVQDEIVRILDSYTQLEQDLESELEAELEARRKQYEYYRDSLLSLENLTNRLGNAVRLVSLKDIASYSAKKIPSSLTDNSSYVGVDNLIANKRGKKLSDYAPNIAKLSRFQPGDILIGNIRPYLRKIWHSDLNGGASGDVLVITIKSEKRKEIISKFLYHVLASENFFEYNNRFARGAKMPRGDKNAVMDYKFPIPPIPEQERIVTILDKFDALVKDLSSGLPAEISARRKQYEYYRDQLLTFTPVK